MAASREELKKRACEAIDKNRDKIIALGESIMMEPELGYKEFKTADKVKKVFDELGFQYRDGVTITGVIAPLKGKESKIRVAVMGELDAVVVPGHALCQQGDRRGPLLRPQRPDRPQWWVWATLWPAPASWKSSPATLC